MFSICLLGWLCKVIQVTGRLMGSAADHVSLHERQHLVYESTIAHYWAELTRFSKAKLLNLQSIAWCFLRLSMRTKDVTGPVGLSSPHLKRNAHQSNILHTALPLTSRHSRSWSKQDGVQYSEHHNGLQAKQRSSEHIATIGVSEMPIFLHSITTTTQVNIW